MEATRERKENQREMEEEGELSWVVLRYQDLPRRAVGKQRRIWARDLNPLPIWMIIKVGGEDETAQV